MAESNSVGAMLLCRCSMFALRQHLLIVSLPCWLQPTSMLALMLVCAGGWMAGLCRQPQLLAFTAEDLRQKVSAFSELFSMPYTKTVLLFTENSTLFTFSVRRFKVSSCTCMRRVASYIHAALERVPERGMAALLPWHMAVVDGGRRHVA